MNAPVRALVLLLMSLTAACAGAPVQEMSDARQAIHAAQALAEHPADRAELAAAERMLREAEAALEARRYDDARRLADAARDGATAVRERATRRPRS